ncbi:MAG: VanW family protein [Actinomycetota bacterium]|nr:VanW family protein [Actinomycetota bacterium]
MIKLPEKKQVRTAIYVCILVVLVAFCLGAADAAFFTNKVHKGVKIAGVSVGGKNKSELFKEIDSIVQVLEEKKVSVIYKEKSWAASPSELDVRINRDKTFKAAYKLGRRGNFLQIIVERISLWLRPRNIEPIYDTNSKKFNAFIKKISKDVNRSAEDAKIKIVETRAVVTNSKNGLEVDKKVLIERLVKAYASKSATRVNLPVKIVKPDITEDKLSKTKDVVETMIRNPLIIKYKNLKWVATTQNIKDWIDFKKVRNGDSWSLNIIFNKEELSTYLKELTKDLVIPPKDAEFKIVGDKVEIVPSQDGAEIDLEKAYIDISEACKREDAREVMISMKTVEPKLSTEDAKKMGIKEKVSSYKTFFNPRQYSRVHNIQLLGSELDGKILAPGEVFSFNKTIGPRTAAKGYKEAPAILNGELVPALGGGVCQVATTLFNTVFFGGYEVVERHNHSFFISHYPTGRDATVSYDGPDLKFKNSSPYYVLIKVITTPRSIEISFYSTSEGYKVSYTTIGPNNYKPFQTKIIEDPTLPKGQRKVFDPGESGRDVTVYRYVYKGDKLVRKDKFFSRYVSKKEIVRVGIGPGAGAAPIESTGTANGTNNIAPIINPQALDIQQ